MWQAFCYTLGIHWLPYPKLCVYRLEGHKRLFQCATQSQYMFVRGCARVGRKKGKEDDKDKD